MALVGQVGVYVDGKEDIAIYIERVELYFAANYVEEDNEVATFLALIGADAYGVLRNLFAPDRPKDTSFVELKELLVAHYSPKPILRAELNGLSFIVDISLRAKRSLSLWSS